MPGFRSSALPRISTAAAASRDAKVSADIKNRNASLVTRTDDQGHFKFSGFSKEIDPKDVEITCTKEGFKLQRTVRRQATGDVVSTVEVDCLMVKP